MKIEVNPPPYPEAYATRLALCGNQLRRDYRPVTKPDEQE